MLGKGQRFQVFRYHSHRQCARAHWGIATPTKATQGRACAQPPPPSGFGAVHICACKRLSGYSIQSIGDSNSNDVRCAGCRRATCCGRCLHKATNTQTESGTRTEQASNGRNAVRYTRQLFELLCSTHQQHTPTQTPNGSPNTNTQPSRTAHLNQTPRRTAPYIYNKRGSRPVPEYAPIGPVQKLPLPDNRTLRAIVMNVASGGSAGNVVHRVPPVTLYPTMYVTWALHR